MSDKQLKRELDFVTSAGHPLTPKELDQSTSLLARWIFDSERIDNISASSREIEPKHPRSNIEEDSLARETS